MPREGKKSPSSQALALLYLRSKRDWSQKELAGRLGWADDKQVSRYERGGRPLSRTTLETAAEVLGYPPEAVEALLFIGRWIEPEGLEEPPSPEPLSPRVRRAIDRSCLTLAWSFLDGWRSKLVREVTRVKVETSRRQAQELWARLKTATRQDRREAVATLAEFQSWALAELVCHESEKAAAHKVEIALELADLALYIAGRIPGEERWRSRVEGYCWAYIANARRVANDLTGADKAFVRAWNLWRAGAPFHSSLLAEWRLLDLEASLRRAERRFSEALTLLDRAQVAIGKDNPSAKARILLKKEHVFDQMGDTRNALATLAEVRPFVEIVGDPRLLFMLFFKTANNLYCLGRYEEAAKELPRVRELAVDQGNELDLIRVVWLEARVAVGEHRKEDATLGLEQVRQDFTARGLPYDAALASLELAGLYLEEGRILEVRNLARAMGWIFQAQGISREALAALTFFFEAAQQETATVDLTRRVAAELERMRASAPQKECKRGRG
jgi:transcriptional regulator with XRE-family HTH domain/tetratricopeptide (TPR) repeat protein